MSREPVRVRASSLSEWFDCAARAEAKHLRGLKTPSSGKSLLGTGLHASTAAYDLAVLNGEPITPGEAFAAAVDAIHRPPYEVEFDDDESANALEGVARGLHHLYCEEIAPLQNYVAVEITCNNVELPELGIVLTGTTDRVIQAPEGYGIADVKSGGTAVAANGTVSTKGHAFQLGVYELIAEHGSGLPIEAPARIIGLQTGKTAKGQRAGVSEPVHGARDVLIGTPESPGVLSMLGAMLKAGVFPPNPRSMMCGPKFCPIYSTCMARR